MPQIKQKSPETIQAQIATFTSEHIEDYRDKEHIFKNIADIALGGVVDRNWTRTYQVRQKDGNRSFIATKQEQRVAATAEQYLDFMKNRTPKDRETIQGRIDLLESYDRFAPLVRQLQSELSTMPSDNKHPDALGEGHFSTVFTVELDEKKYAVRLPGDEATPDTMDLHIQSAINAHGVPHLEQMVAASYEDGVTISEIMPGKTLSDLSLEEMDYITDSQLSDLIDTFHKAMKLGIAFDVSYTNILYDEDEGFGLIDLVDYADEYDKYSSQDIELTLNRLTYTIDSLTLGAGMEVKGWTAEDYARRATYSRKTAGLFRQLLSVLALRRELSDKRRLGLEVEISTLESSAIADDSVEK